MWCKVGSIAIIVLAVVVGVLACSPFLDQVQNYLLVVAKFFDVLLPILGVGALLKYLLKRDCCPCCKSEKCQTKTEPKTDE
ncbi:MAG: hypothetical protein HKM04_10655 [Legionellales bacterium]|nr:hypothetical protein [Legionellales bacterium]